MHIPTECLHEKQNIGAWERAYKKAGIEAVVVGYIRLQVDTR